MRWNSILEHAIVGKLVDCLVQEGFRIEMSDQDCPDGLTYVYAWKDEVGRPVDGVKYYVKLVPGNGADVISDYTTNLETVLKDVNEFASQYA